MRSATILLMLLAFGCGTKYVLPPTVPPGEARVEERPLPPDPATEPLPAGMVEENKVEGLEQGDPAPFPGILVSEDRATRDGYFRIRYPELRKQYEGDQQVWKAHRELYETRLVLADQAIRDLQPTWWERNAFSLGLFGGSVLGTALTVAIFAVVN
jgi:hypothetical protein